MAPKYLIQRFPLEGIGIIHLWTAALAKRSDMAVYDGEVPASMRIQLNAPAAAEKPVAFKNNLEGNAVFPADTPSLPPLPMTSAVPGAPLDRMADETATEGVKKASEGDNAETIPEGKDLTPVFTPEQKQVKLVEIIGTWTPEDPENFTTTGLPRLDSLIAELGADVETRERDEAWAKFQKQAKKQKA